jgi:hypothetical protein
MPGYWNRDDSKERATGVARQERRQEERQGGGGQDRFSQSQAYQESQQRYIKQQNIDKMARAQESQRLGSALRNVGINKDQLQRYMDAGILPQNVAIVMGLAKPGEHWDPRGKFTEDMKLGLEEQQFALDEGVYGGVAGIESEVNKTKGEIQNIAQDIINKNPNISTEDLKAQIEATPEAKGLAALWDGDMSRALMNTFGMRDPDFGSEEAWEAKIPGTDIYKSAGDVGYDPTGAYTFSDIESDPNLYNKYLNRGTLWDDPLSGVLKPRGPQFTGGGGGGWGGYGGYGGGGSGGGGGYDMGLPGYGGPVYQRGQVGPGSLQENVNQLYYGMSQGAQPKFSRGGIVSLLRLGE